jgi:hypothetical protein
MLSVKIEIVDSPDVWLICAKVRNSFRLYPVSEVTVEFTLLQAVCTIEGIVKIAVESPMLYV